MKKGIIALIVFLLLFSTLNFGSSKPISQNNLIDKDETSIDNSNFNEPQEQKILQNLNSCDGFFTENRGQVGNDSVRYYIQGKGVWFLDSGVVFEIVESQESEEWPYIDRHDFDDLNTNSRKTVVLKLNLEGRNKVIPKGKGILPHRSNFFYGNDPDKWCTEVPNFQELIYENIYGNIDLRYYFSDKGLKYDFIVYPGGDLNDIILSYEGAQNLFVDQNDDLVIQTPLNNFIDSELAIYQNVDNNRDKIEGHFKILAPNSYSFEVTSKYDCDTTLVIDPLLYSTYEGGSGSDNGWEIEIDTLGNAYVVGYTPSSDFPTTPGAMNTTFNGGSDIYFLKLDPTGSTLLYSTFIGGGGTDRANGFEMDDSYNSYLTGYTYSSDFPITAGAYNSTYNSGNTDAFVLKLSSTGTTILYSTFVGGDSLDYGNDLAIDSNLDIYVTGETASTNFPTTSTAFAKANSGGRDVFVTKVNPGGNGVSDLMYSTYIGDTNNDCGISIAVDSSDVAFVAGETASYSFPTTVNAYDTDYNDVPPGIDTFVLKLNQTGSLLQYSTYIGGGHNDFPISIAIDASGDAYVSGYTGDNTFPNTTGAYDRTFNGGWDCFLFKMSPTGTGLNDLVYSTFIGEFSNDYSGKIVLDASGNVYMTGSTNSVDFPTTPGALNTTINGGTDGFALTLDSSGASLLYSTFIGGGDSDRGNDITLDASGNVFVTGRTLSSDFPTSPTANDTTHNGNYDAFILKLGLDLNFPPTVLDLQSSKASIPRTYPVYIYANATDPEDLEQNLTPYFEYRDPNEQAWNSTNQSNQKYNNSRWELSFTPAKNATLGSYDFRVKFNDTGYFFSPWYYLNDSVMVVNNFPIVENLTFSNNSAILFETISVFINGSDVENGEANLTIELEYRDPSEQVWNSSYLNGPKYLNERWEYNFTIPIDAPFGYFDFRVRFNDSDGNYSKWLYFNDSLLVYNTPPKIIDLKLSKNSVYRTDSIFIHINSTDYETPEAMLNVYIQYKHSTIGAWSDLTGVYSQSINNWQVEFVTQIETGLGLYDLRARFVDNESASSGWSYWNGSLLVLNNIPVLENIDLSNTMVYRTNSITIFANVTDVETPEILMVCDAQYRPPSGTWMALEDVDYYSDHWEVTFAPKEDAELGLYDFRINFTDQDAGDCGWSEIEYAIEVKNNLPTISELCDDFEVGISLLEMNLSQFGSDLEDHDEDLKWSIDETTVDQSLFAVEILGTWNNILHIVPVENTTGIDDFKLELTDKDGGTTMRSDVTVHVDSRITAQTPKVTLLSPVNRAILSTLTPKLDWELEYEGDETITYTVVLDQAPEPQTEIASGLAFTSHTLQNDLEDGKTYYWKVIPAGGICISEPFRFTINLGFEPEYKVNLTADKESLVIKQGETAEINLKIKNEGNTIDKFQIECISTRLQSYIDLDKTNIQLESNLETDLKLVVTIPVEFQPSKDHITVTATSINDLAVKDKVNITVEVVDKDFEPNYDVDVSISPGSIEIEKGGSETVTLTITNTGNIVDDYTIRIESSDLESTNIVISKITTALEAGDHDQIVITIIIPENMKPGEYMIEFIVESDTVLDSTEYDIEVSEKGDGEGSEGDSEEDNTMLYAGISIIVIILIVVMILLFLFLKQKKAKEEAPIEEEQLYSEQPPTTEVPPPEQPPQDVPVPEVQPQVRQFEPPPPPQPALIPQVEAQPVPAPQVEQPQVEVQEPAVVEQPAETQPQPVPRMKEPKIVNKVQEDEKQQAF